tara:strand:+ start:201 stop:590 length:390 start_codon:yes stop_codon:yes gene_type:complete
MRRNIVLLLITGVVWSQTDFDTLVLKDGTTYLGEYSKTEKEIVYFKPQNAFAFQPVPAQFIKRLKLKDGDYIIGLSSRSIFAVIINRNSKRNRNMEIGCSIMIIALGLLILNNGPDSPNEWLKKLGKYW